jgi:predicted nucleic acid-binding protein
MLVLTLIARLSKHAVLALSTLTITELRSGWTKEQANWLLPRLYALCTVVPVTKEIAEQAGIWRQEYKSRGQSISRSRNDE